MIRSLPLFESVNGDLISIENDKKVGIISSRIPPHGMKEIAEATNTTFVKINIKYSNLLKRLSSSYDVDRLYAEIIVPNFQAISYDHRLKHLEYIKDHVCRDVTETSGYTEEIIRNLMDIQLIRIGKRERRIETKYLLKCLLMINSFQSVADIDYLLGFKEMEIFELTDAVAIFKSLPNSMQPSFLSEVVVESVFLDSIETVHSPVYSNFSTRIEHEGRIFARKFREGQGHYHSFVSGGNLYIPVPNIGEARLWLRQAKTDFQVASGMLDKHDDSFKGFNWICYQLHQACEKALKAARFSKDANRCPRKSHNLCSIADGVESDDIKEKTREFESRLNISGSQYFRLRYPDAVGSEKLPSDVFSSDDAAFAKETAEHIIALVDDCIE
ncbi:uncharacterized protein LOC128241353 [Mya arenaria]|uniref:uncharacterized protein LOC128241353 n=1 Tax=Mya arenaria TaxID=6604 RepID=UPI0022E4F103|nr:uncharacterized protein LOC128241353 [Mya arenaria]